MTRLPTSRVSPIDVSVASDVQAKVLARLVGRNGRTLEIFKTLAHWPEALEGFAAWGGYVLSKRNSLPARERELVILRTAYRCRCGYEWAHHAEIGEHAGLTLAERDRIKRGPGAQGWSANDALLLTATDELIDGQFLEEPTWCALERLGIDQRAALVFTVGQYVQVSMMLNAFGVQLEEGYQLDPDLDFR